MRWRACSGLSRTDPRGALDRRVLTRQLGAMLGDMDKPMDETVDVYALLRAAVEARIKMAKSMLSAYAANALEKPATPEDLAHWKGALAEAEAELATLQNSKRT